MSDDQLQKIFERSRLEKSNIPLSEVENTIQKSDSSLLARRLALSVLGLFMAVIGAFVYFKNDSKVVDTSVQQTVNVETDAVINKKEELPTIATSQEEKEDTTPDLSEEKTLTIFSNSESEESIQEEKASIDTLSSQKAELVMDVEVVPKPQIVTQSKADKYKFTLKKTFDESELSRFKNELSKIGVVVTFQKIKYNKFNIIERIKGHVQKRQFEHHNFEKLLFIVNQDGKSNRGVNIIQL